MATIKATATLTITASVDIVSTTIYYLLQSSTAPAPNKPTTDPPGGSWSTTEPTYTEGSTNTLYTVTKTKYSGNIPGTNTDFEYTPVSKSTSYEAAKNAYIKAVNALNTANSAASKVIFASSNNGTYSPPAPPSPYDQIWYDTYSNQYLKYFPEESGYGDDTAGWKVVSSKVATIEDIRSKAEYAFSEVGNTQDKIDSSLSEYYNDVIKTYIDGQVKTNFTLSKTQAQISVIKTLFKITEQPGETWYEGNKIYRTGNTVVSNQSNISSAAVGDYYLNNETGDIFICTTAGNPSTAVWVYSKSILDTGKGSLDNVTTYFNFQDDLTIGRTGYKHKLVLSPDQIAMMYSNTPNNAESFNMISYWNSTSFVTNYLQALEAVSTKYINASEKQRIGNFVWAVNNDGSISLKQEVE